MKTYIINKILLLAAILSFSACSIETELINYGKDNCTFCKMTIMDKQFGTELVTLKGKVFKFDDLSCMSKYMKTAELHEADCKHVVVSNFEKPGEFIDFNKAFYIQSENLQSPMLGNTAAFNSEISTQKFASSDSLAKNITWTEIKDLFK
jgi:copper chaperone NosL